MASSDNAKGFSSKGEYHQMTENDKNNLDKSEQGETDSSDKTKKHPYADHPHLDVISDKPQKVIEKVAIPVDRYPKINFLGKLLGPKGSTMRRLQDETMTRISIYGRGSIRDKAKEEELRKEGGKYAHLNEKLHVHIEAYAECSEAHSRIAHALAELKKFMIPTEEELRSSGGDGRETHRGGFQSGGRGGYENGGGRGRGRGRGGFTGGDSGRGGGRGGGVDRGRGGGGRGRGGASDRGRGAERGGGGGGGGGYGMDDSFGRGGYPEEYDEVPRRAGGFDHSRGTGGGYSDLRGGYDTRGASTGGYDQTESYSSGGAGAYQDRADIYGGETRSAYGRSNNDYSQGGGGYGGNARNDYSSRGGEDWGGSYGGRSGATVADSYSTRQSGAPAATRGRGGADSLARDDYGHGEGDMSRGSYGGGRGNGGYKMMGGRGGESRAHPYAAQSRR